MIIAIAGVAAAAVILFAIPLALVLQTSNRDQELLRLQRDTVADTRAVDLGTAGGDPVELPASHDRLAVYDTTGRRVTGRGPARADETARAALRSGSPAAGAADGRLISAVPLLARERVTGVLRAERSDAAAVRATHRAWIALIALAALLVALAAMAAALLGRRLARPLERLAAAARRLGDGDFAARAPRAAIEEADAIAAALDHTAQRLGDLIARERTFTADASHQLRTPLAALRLELEAIELRGDPPPELERALAQVERLQSTVATFLAVARDAPRSSGRADLRVLLDDLRERWQGRLAADARPLRARWHTDAHLASASPTVVTEILDVLVDNAHHHGRGPVTITVRAADQWLAIDVADEGPGFSGDTTAAFERRLPRSGGGHGIGLALAEALADAEGGRLSITQASPPTVTIWLARSGEAARSAVAGAAPESSSDASRNASAPT